MRGSVLHKLSSVAVALFATQVGSNVAIGAPIGEDLFRAKCVGCHAISCNRLGPKLVGVIGRKAGSVPDFASYTPALKNSGLVWSEETLDAFLRDPARTIPGTSMAALGRIDSASDRSDLIAYLRVGDTGLDLCF
jgi:cytochrome c